MEYLSPDLNINRMYSAFKNSYPNSTVSYRFYYIPFKTKFPKLNFHHSHTDTCQTCDLLNMECKVDPNSKTIKARLELHHRKAEKAMKAMKEDHAKDFAQIEKRRRLEKCEVPLDLVRLIRTATPQNPFNVLMMTTEDFFDFKTISEKFLQTSKFQISTVQWLRISNKDPGIDIKSVGLPELACKNIIKPEKKKDLEAILNFVKPGNKEFYQNIIK
ncbi:hypothetical protein CBL_12835 [Carabus blaptoides fortunei]